MMRLEGKVALITGAATGVQGELMGFGGASARLFVREGAKVVLGDINEESGQQTVSQIREDGGDALFVRLDVTREEDWINAIQTTIASFGR
ncbi:MAG: SDR family NAD(P)-dependent oxidoreductase, partial [Dehalococcoidia bacterium]